MHLFLVLHFFSQFTIGYATVALAFMVTNVGKCPINAPSYKNYTSDNYYENCNFLYAHSSGVNVLT